VAPLPAPIFGDQMPKRACQRRKPVPFTPAEWVNLFPGNDREIMAELREKERRYHEIMHALCVAAGVVSE